MREKKGMSIAAFDKGLLNSDLANMFDWGRDDERIEKKEKKTERTAKINME